MGFFSLCQCVKISSRADPASYSMGTGALIPGIKWLGCEADHSPPLVPRLRMDGTIHPLPQYVSMAWWLTMQEMSWHGIS
jgi:hypothetical protein